MMMMVTATSLLGLGAARTVDVTLSMGVMEYQSKGIHFLTRAYNGTIPGPTIYVNPGDTLRVTLVNELQRTAALPESDNDTSVWCGPTNCTTATADSVFSIPNRTNLHTHGLHTSPLPPGDDVLYTAVGPQSKHSYTYSIPKDHMAGTFWYHPHLDGSVALQTAGGAAGLLIVNDTRGKDEDRRGVSKQVLDMDEQEIFIQTVPQSALRGISRYSGDQLIHIYNQAPPQLHRVDNNQFADGQGVFNASLIDNVALLNGEFIPKLKMKAGQWVRWRIVHAGPAFFMDLSIESDKEDGSEATGRKDASSCELQLLAKDGIYLQQAPRQLSRVVLPPGGRADVAIRCKGSGHMRLASGARPGNSGAWNGDMYWNPRIAKIHVHDDDALPTLRHSDLEVFHPERPRYLQDLRNAAVNARFSLNFTDAKSVQPGHDQEHGSTGRLQEAFPYNGDDSGTCLFNGMTFNRSTPLGELPLEAVNEWSVSGVQGHPLHIHVNPHEVVFLTSMNASSNCDAEYGYVCLGDFHDTLQLPQPDGIASARIRFRTADFSGPQVLHCHYLIHEDLGCISFHHVA